MPTVGKKKFAYTKEGIKEAKRYAKRKKRAISKKYDKGGTTEPGKSKIISIKKAGKYEIVTATNPATGKGRYKYRRLAKPENKTGGKNTGFSKAFRTARDAGKKEFTWNGKRYHTKTKSEVKKYDEGGTYQYTPPSFADMFDVGSKMKLFGGGNKPASERAKLRHERKMARQGARQERKMDRQSDRQERRQDRINYRRYEK